MATLSHWYKGCRQWNTVSSPHHRHMAAAPERIRHRRGNIHRDVDDVWVIRRELVQLPFEAQLTCIGRRNPSVRIGP